MNDRQALTEARKRWGKNGIIEKRKKRVEYPKMATHIVGVLTPKIAGFQALMVRGQGQTWKEAFTNAEKRYPQTDN